jgi:hypothetical protein
MAEMLNVLMHTLNVLIVDGMSYWWDRKTLAQGR